MNPGYGSAPAMGRYLDIPVLPDWRRTDSVGSMTAIMQEHARGMFIRAALLVDEMMSDDRISGVLSTRIGGLLCADLSFKPADDRKKSLKLARILGGSDEAADDGEWLRMLDFDTAFALLKWKIMLGVAVAEIVWEADATSWSPRLQVYHPSHVWWNWADRRYNLITNGPDPLKPIMLGDPAWMIPLPRSDRREEHNGHWFVWGGPYSWMQGAIRSLGMKYLDRIWNERDWARYNEKHGMALIEGKVPAGADAGEKARFEHDVNRLNNEPVIITPQAEDGQPSYGIEFHEATSKSWETYKARKETLDTDIAVCLLGQNLTSEVQGGSLAAASIHEGIRIDKKRQDAELYRQLRLQVLIPWVDYKEGPGKGEHQAPYPQAQIAPPEDEESNANALKLLGEALQALMLAYPAVDVRAMIETAGVPIDEEIASVIDEVKRMPSAPPPPPPTGGAGGGGEGGPGPTQGQKQGQADVSGGDEQADPADQKTKAELTTAVLTAMAQLKAAKAGGPAALKRVAKYHDAIVARARRNAASMLGKDLVEIRNVIQASSGFADLKHKLVAHFKMKRSPKELAALLERVNLLAHMTGRLDVLQGV